MTEIKITREDGKSGGRYVAVVNGHEAEMTYSRAGTERIIIDHTGVPRELGGHMSRGTWLETCLERLG